MNECRKIIIDTDYNMYGKISYNLPEFHVKMINSDFSENVKLEMFVKTELCDSLTSKITDITNGRASVKTDNSIVFEDFAGI